MGTIVVRKLGLRNWMCSVSGLFLMTNLHSKQKALRMGTNLMGDLDMGMQDNPLVGEYTKGVSSNSKRYFDNLDSRIRREKVSPKPIVMDLANPLFAMIKGPVDPMGLDRFVRKTVAQKIGKAPPKRVELPKKEAKKRWRTVSLAELSTALSGT